MFPKGERQPEAMLGVLLAIIEKTPAGGASFHDLCEAYENAKGFSPSDKSIQRVIRRINDYFDPENIDPAISATGHKENRRYRFVREWAPEQKLETSQAMLMALSLYPQQRQMMTEQFDRIMKLVFDHAHGAVKEWQNMQEQVDRYVYVSGFSPVAMRQTKNILSQALRAIHSRKRLRFNYTRLYDGFTVKSREVDPYGLLCRNGTWYLVGLCHEARERRVFRIELIDNLRIVENSTYTIPDSFSLKESYATSWGTWTTNDHTPAERVRLKVAEGMAKKFAVTRYHDSQAVAENDDGTAEVQFQVVHAEEMIPWLMTWGPTVEILEPDWLRQQLVDNARSMLQVYAGKPSVS